MLGCIYLKRSEPGPGASIGMAVVGLVACGWATKGEPEPPICADIRRRAVVVRTRMTDRSALVSCGCYRCKVA